MEGIHRIDGVDPVLCLLVVRPSLSSCRINLLLEIVEGRREHGIPVSEVGLFEKGGELIRSRQTNRLLEETDQVGSRQRSILTD